MSEIHLAGETGKQIPACGQYGKDAGERKDAEEVRVFGKQRQKEEKEKEECDNDTGREHKSFVFNDGKQFFQVEENEAHKLPFFLEGDTK